MKKLLFALTALVLLSAPLAAVRPVKAALGPNLIANSTLETSTNNSPDGWSAGGWGTNTRSLTYETEGNSGVRSLKAQITSYSDGDAKWYFSPVAVTPNTSYSFSDYYKSTVGSTLVAQVESTSGGFSYMALGSTSPASVWSQSSTTFTTPGDAKNLTVFHLISSVGSLQIDDVYLGTFTAVPAPTVNIGSPSAGATLSGNQTITANASSSEGIAGVQFKLDGQNLGSEVTTSPYLINWNTLGASNGSHNLVAAARSLGGQTTTSSTVTVSVNNPVPAGSNLVNNGSLETVDPANTAKPQSWVNGGWGINTVAYSYENSGRTGSRSVKTQITSYTNGDAKWYFTPVLVQPGANYDYTDYYQSSVNTNVFAQFDDGNGSHTYQYLGTASASPSSWSHVQYSFTALNTTKYVTIFHTISSAGWLQIDDVSLILPPVIVTTNLIANPSMEKPANTTKPQSWTSSKWGTNNTTFSYLTTGRTGSRSVKTQITSYTNGDAKWYFDPVSVAQDTQYVFSDYYQSNISSQVYAAFTLNDGSTRYQYLGTAGSSPASWANFYTKFSVPLGAKNLTVYHLINKVGYLTVDDYDVHSYTPVGFNRGLVSITFDDGISSQYTNGLPLLQKYNFKATEYIVSGLIGQPGYMTTSMLGSLKNAGMEIGSHTVSHSDLTTLSLTQLTSELMGSQLQLQTWMGTPITNFAAPYGAVNSQVTSEIKKYYRSHRGVESGFNSRDNFNIYNIKVQDVDVNTTVAEVADWVAQAKATNTWLVLVYHAVDPNVAAVGQFDVTPTMLDAQLAAIKLSGLTVTTVSQALNEITPQI